MASWFRWKSREGKDKDLDEAPARTGFSPRVKWQLLILALCRFAEPVALTSVFPYLYFMIESFHVAKDDIAFWVGITAASFAFSQFASGVFWGRASDRFGRKPTILIGLLGTLISSLLFGLSRSLPQAIAARCLSGLLNGNVGILRTFVAEIVPEKHLQPRAFSLMPLTWAVGSTFGPVIGGYLADPVKNYPQYFSPGGFFTTYPYALPNFFNAGLFILGATIGFLFLEEPLEARKNDRDIGRELGRKIVSVFPRKPHHHHKVNREEFDGEDETTPLIIPDEEDGRHPQLTRTTPKHHHKPPALHEAFTKQSTLNIVVYAFLALQSVSYDQMLPVYMSFPTMANPPEPKKPLKYFGGFGLRSSEIGSILSAFGFFAMFSQFFIFPPITSRYGSLKCLQVSLGLFPLVYFLSPFAVILKEEFRRPFLYGLVSIKSIGGIFSFPCITILLTNSAPSLRVLGTLNGIATAMAALGRALGPTVGGVAFSYGQKIDYLVFPFWFMGCLALIGWLPSFTLVEGKGFARDEGITEEQAVETASSTQSTVVSESSSSLSR
ncbi:major facilitator superfamily domain-containing protein [Tirmania nivea]|nr:major facilitator superfamily domain-containing protein [Tirmania nivea]